MSHSHALEKIMDEELFRVGNDLSTYIYTALDAQFDAPLKTIPCMRRIRKVFVISSQFEPRRNVARSGGLLEITESSTGILLNKVGICPGGGKGRSEVDGLSNVARRWIRDGLGASDLEYRRDSNLH